MSNLVKIGKIDINGITMNQAIDYIEKCLKYKHGGTAFTPNVDHIVQAEFDERLQRAYENCTLSLVDGMPVLWASKLLGKPLPEKISGSDLIFPLLSLANDHDYKIYILGSSQDKILRAIDNLKKDYHFLNIVGHSSPFLSKEVSYIEVMESVTEIKKYSPDLVLVCLGAPKQEYFISMARHFLPKSFLVGLGASIDFISKDVKRAPKWMQKVGLEWFYRLCQEPKRLSKRYIKDLYFFIIIFKQFFKIS